MSGETDAQLTPDLVMVMLQRRMDDLEKHFDALLSAELRRLQQQFEAQEKAGDKAFAAQTTAMETARIAAQRALDERAGTLDREFHEHLVQYRHEVTTAFQSSDRAISKAETANEKRFECVAADTPVLCTDLVWRPAGDLLVGDELVGCDEEAPTRRGRRFRRSVVTHNTLTRDALLLVTTSDGSVRCNSRHPWLARRQSGGTWRWVKTEDLQPGDQVSKPLDVWATDRSWEAGWLAGMYDGEGCLTLDRNHRSQLTLTQRASPTSDLIERSLKARIGYVGCYRVEPGKYKHTQPFFHFVVTRVPDVMTLLGSTRPPRLLAKADGVWDAKPLGGWGRAVEVTSIESVGTGMIANLSTSTATYIAGGFTMHNSVNEFRAQLADQAAQFMPRTEYDANHDALIGKVEDGAKRVQDQFAEVNRRLDLTQGTRAGAAQLWVVIGGAFALFLAILGIVSYFNS